MTAMTPASAGRSGSPTPIALRSLPSWRRALTRNTTCAMSSISCALVADAAGADPLAAAHDRAGLRRAHALHLLDADRRGFPACALSDPSASGASRGRPTHDAASTPGDLAHPASQ